MTYDETVMTLARELAPEEAFKYADRDVWAQEESTNARKDVKAILAAIKPGMELGNGLVAVPKEPTDEMINAAVYYYKRSATWKSIYLAMIAAAEGEE